MAFRLVYVSSGILGLQSSHLQDILSVSQRFNAENGITGMLLFLEGNFIQVLEGEQDSVENLAKRISGDKRHRDFQILQREMSSDFLFPDWSMGLKIIDPDD